ncbi:MAG: amidohydrolase [Bacteroidales bacterium]|nr:amidohydrolase [Bacteroidales bacterium]
MIRIFIIFIILFTGCQMERTKVDLLIKDTTIYTVDDSFTKVEALAIKDGKILDTGSSAAMERKYEADSTISLPGRYVYPGWNDAHCHFTGYGLSLNHVDLTGTGSIDEVIKKCLEFRENHPVQWITGRGWDQNDWKDQSFPHKNDLDQFFPDQPVLLKRVDGHAGWANSKALDLAGITTGTTVKGGTVMTTDGQLTGILIDNAIDLVARIIPEPGSREIVAGLKNAEINCFGVGLTSVSDAGLSTKIVRIIDSLHSNNELNMRINAWLEPSESNMETFVKNGVIQNDKLTVSTIKLYADGTLGSRGAKMIEPYSDDPGNSGLYLMEPQQLRNYSKIALENNYQVATHCIGDAANRTVLNIYAKLLEEGNDRRWRIEHAQIIAPEDFYLFGKYQIVPSVQPTHATSDMYWVEDRLGKERLKGAYSYNTLMNLLGWIPFGSDFPVESINPLFGFYAAVSRKDHEGYPANGFIKEEAISRKNALKAMTIWPAKAAFEEKFKGSLEAGKLADLVVTEQDIMTIDESRIPAIKVILTISGGEIVYEKN